MSLCQGIKAASLMTIKVRPLQDNWVWTHIHLDNGALILSTALLQVIFVLFIVFLKIAVPQENPEDPHPLSAPLQSSW